MINRENLIKIGRAGGNTLNREGWNFWKNTTLWKRIFGNSFFNAFAGGLTSKGGGEGLLLHVFFCLQVTGVYYKLQVGELLSGS